MTTPNASGSTRERTTITMEADLLARAKAAGGGNLSAYVSKAVRRSLMADAMLEVRRLRSNDPMDDVYEAAQADAAEADAA